MNQYRLRELRIKHHHGQLSEQERRELIDLLFDVVDTLRPRNVTILELSWDLRKLFR